MTEPHLSFSEIRSAAHDLAERRREARAEYEKLVRVTAQAEAEYRSIRAQEFLKLRAGGEGKGVGESELLADGCDRVVGAKAQRDINQGMMKAVLLRIEELEADRAMLRQLGAWSQELEAVG